VVDTLVLVVVMVLLLLKTVAQAVVVVLVMVQMFLAYQELVFLVKEIVEVAPLELLLETIQQVAVVVQLQ
jgi:hypothetical protein